MLALTVSLGLYVWSWAAGQAGRSEGTLASSSAERFMIVDVTYNGKPIKSVTLWVYNAGSSPVLLEELTFGNQTASYTNTTLTDSANGVQGCPYCLSVASQGLVKISFDPQMGLGGVYVATLVSSYGNTASYTTES